MNDTMQIFDRAQVRRNRDKAARGDFDAVNFLFQETADRLADRLLDISRTFRNVLDLGCHAGEIRRCGIPFDHLIQSDLSHGMAQRAASGGWAVNADEEWLPFAEESFDLVLTNLSLHWVNDLPGALIQINRSLKPDGLLLGALLGGETLKELRECLTAAEAEQTNGVSPRVSPFTDLRDAGGLMQRAGFALPVIDSDIITVTYENAFALMNELRQMGEGNAIVERTRRPLRRSVVLRAAEIYQDRYADSDNRIPATFQVIYLHGWAPHESQQKPLRPGTARNRLATALSSKEQSAGEKAG